MNTNGLFDDLDFGDFSAPSSGSSRKVPICLVLDCSGSMRYADGTKRPKIDELNYNIDAFLEYVRNDPKASKICDLCIITMGDAVHVISRYNTVDRIHFGHFAASGGTPLGTAMKKEILKIYLTSLIYYVIMHSPRAEGSFFVRIFSHAMGLDPLRKEGGTVRITYEYGIYPNNLWRC